MAGIPRERDQAEAGKVDGLNKGEKKGQPKNSEHDPENRFALYYFFYNLVEENLFFGDLTTK